MFEVKVMKTVKALGLIQEGYIGNEWTDVRIFGEYNPEKANKMARKYQGRIFRMMKADNRPLDGWRQFDVFVRFIDEGCSLTQAYERSLDPDECWIRVISEGPEEAPLEAEEALDFDEYILSKHGLMRRENREEALHELKNGAALWHTPFYSESVRFNLMETDSKAAEELIDTHDGIMEESRMWVDQWAAEVGFDSLETEDTELYESKLEEHYTYLCRLYGIEPAPWYVSK